MSFEVAIPKLIEQFTTAWNNADMDKVSDLFEDDAILKTPGLVFSNAVLDPQLLQGNKSVMDFLIHARETMPLEAEPTNLNMEKGKLISFKVHYYKINVWSYFECVISNYGRFQEMKILRLEDHEAHTINTVYLLKNIVRFRLKKIFK